MILIRARGTSACRQFAGDEFIRALTDGERDGASPAAQTYFFASASAASPVPLKRLNRRRLK